MLQRRDRSRNIRKLDSRMVKESDPYEIQDDSSRGPGSPDQGVTVLPANRNRRKCAADQSWRPAGAQCGGILEQALPAEAG